MEHPWEHGKEPQHSQQRVFICNLFWLMLALLPTSSTHMPSRNLLEIPLQLIPSPDSLLQDSTSCVSSSLHFSGHLGKDTHPDVDSLILMPCVCLVGFKSVHCHYLQCILQEAEELNKKWHGVFPILMTVSTLYISFRQNMIEWNIEVSLSWE